MRTRFAPSPTGFLHVGGLRTALYSYLMAKKETDGVFLLRIEDTDQERSVPGAIENIIQSLAWAGIQADEGVMLRKGEAAQVGRKGPYIQSERLDLYKKYAAELLASGSAYHCFCTSERLEQMREEQMKDKRAPMYDRLCMSLPKEEVERRLQAGDPYVLRMKIPRNQLIEFQDEIRGKVSFQGSVVDDQVLLKSDGFPTYHLAHVVDDHLMDIDLVIRGEEWLSSLPKHLLLFQYLGWNPPRYAHVPLLLNKDRSKLSKRQGSVAVEEYIAKGYLPEALINFLAMLGWNPGTTQELFSLPELIDAFEIDRIQKSGAIFDIEKLDWIQGQWIRRLAPEEFAARIKPLVEAKYSDATSDKDFVEKAKLIQDRLLFFPEAPEMLSFLYEEPAVDKDMLASEKQKVTKEILPEILQSLVETLESVSDWSLDNIKAALEKSLVTSTYKKGQILWPLRVALTGKPFSPGAYEVAAVLGRGATLKRLRKVL